MSTIRVEKHLRNADANRKAALGNALAIRLSRYGMLVLAASILSMLPMLGLTGCARTSQAAIKLPDTDVLVAAPVQRDVPVHSEWVATTDGYVNAEIRPQVSGYIIRQDYKEGSFVRKGEVLFEIDPRPFQAVLDHAKADPPRAEKPRITSGVSCIVCAFLFMSRSEVCTHD